MVVGPCIVCMLRCTFRRTRLLLQIHCEFFQRRVCFAGRRRTI